MDRTPGAAPTPSDLGSVQKDLDLASTIILEMKGQLSQLSQSPPATPKPFAGAAEQRTDHLAERVREQARYLESQADAMQRDAARRDGGSSVGSDPEATSEPTSASSGRLRTRRTSTSTRQHRAARRLESRAALSRLEDRANIAERRAVEFSKRHAASSRALRQRERDLRQTRARLDRAEADHAKAEKSKALLQSYIARLEARLQASLRTRDEGKQIARLSRQLAQAKQDAAEAHAGADARVAEAKRDGDEARAALRELRRVIDDDAFKNHPEDAMAGDGAARVATAQLRQRCRRLERDAATRAYDLALLVAFLREARAAAKQAQADGNASPLIDRLLDPRLGPPLAPPTLSPAPPALQWREPTPSPARGVTFLESAGRKTVSPSLEAFDTKSYADSLGGIGAGSGTTITLAPSSVGGASATAESEGEAASSWLGSPASKRAGFARTAPRSPPFTFESSPNGRFGAREGVGEEGEEGEEGEASASDTDYLSAGASPGSASQSVCGSATKVPRPGLGPGYGGGRSVPEGFSVKERLMHLQERFKQLDFHIA